MTENLKKSKHINNVLYDMKLHDTIDIQKIFDNYLPYQYVTRVPGGWIYSNYNTNKDKYTDKIFIPYNNDMQVEEGMEY